MRSIYGQDFTSARLWRYTFAGVEGEHVLEYGDDKPEELDLPEGLTIRPAQTSPYYVRPRGDGTGGRPVGVIS